MVKDDGDGDWDDWDESDDECEAGPLGLVADVGDVLAALQRLRFLPPGAQKQAWAADGTGQAAGAVAGSELMKGLAVEEQTCLEWLLLQHEHQQVQNN